MVRKAAAESKRAVGLLHASLSAKFLPDKYSKRL
jgi:hypothetical protein